MKKPVIAVFFFASAYAHAQISLLKKNEISPVLSEVIKDYPQQFIHLKGDIVDEGPQFTSYNCMQHIKGLEDGTITMYGDEKERSYSWQNNLFNTEDFEKAKAEYKSIFARIKGTTASVKNIEVKLIADYTEPDENLRFTSIFFKLETVDDSFKDVVVELSLRNEIDTWNISVKLYHLEDAYLKAQVYSDGNDDQ